MAIRWHFVEQYLGDDTRWSWRVLEADGTIEHQSQSFRTYGEAVNEAIRHGFQPRQQHWIVATRHAITHFRPGKPPLTVTVAESHSLQAVPKPHTQQPDSRARPKRSRNPHPVFVITPRKRG
jgi:hypothetical protein